MSATDIKLSARRPSAGRPPTGGSPCAFSSPEHQAGSARAVVPELTGAGHAVVGLARSDASAGALAGRGRRGPRGVARRPRRAARRGLLVRRRDPPRVQARHRLRGRLRRCRRGGPARDRDLRRGPRRQRQALRDRLRVLGLAPGRRRHRAATGSTRRAPAGERPARGPERRRANAQLDALVRRPRDPFLGRAATADLSRRRRQRLHPDRDRLRPREGRGGLRRRRRQPLAGGPPRRRRRPVPPRARVRAGRVGVCTRSATKACRSARSPRSSPRSSEFPPCRSSPEQAGEYVGWLGGFWGLDSPASAEITRELLGWQPTGPGLIADLEEGHYFA